jgi:type I restriction enzyme, S subunit
MTKLKEYKLSDVCHKIGSGATPRGGQESYLTDGEYTLIRSQNVLDFNFTMKGLAYINESQALKLKNVEIKERDILINITGDSVARVCQVPSKILPARVNQHVAILRPNSDIINNEYLKYYLLEPKIKDYLLMISSSGGTRNAITKNMLEELVVKVPDLPTQTAITEILSSLDDKIELNNKINKELESLAQTLFKQWFIDFEFPNENGKPYKSSGGEMLESELGEIPKGWGVDSLDNIAEFLNGLALQKFPPESDYEFLPVIKIKELRQKDTSNSDKASINIPEKYIIENGDVLFSWSGSLMIDFWTNGKGALNQHLFKVTSKEYPKWYYYLWTKHHLTEFIAIAESKATTMGHIQRQHLTNAKVLVPTEDIITIFSLVFEPIISKIIDNRIECGELIKLRDTLLPKLISGEIEINETNN